jgi:glycerol-3-phosphate acyltransferase PlsY
MIASGVVLVVSYLFGSILFGVVIVRVLQGVDPRQFASRNPGATNVMRLAGRGAGAAALVLDASKGAAAVLLARAFSPQSDWLPAAAAVAVVLGHLFPVFYGFRGGKGVATALGAFLGLSYQPVLLAVVVFMVVLGLLRFVSLASMTAVVSFVPLAAVWGESIASCFSAALVAVLVVARHHENISRLRRGVEPRVGGRARGRT